MTWEGEHPQRPINRNQPFTVFHWWSLLLNLVSPSVNHKPGPNRNPCSLRRLSPTHGTIPCKFPQTRGRRRLLRFPPYSTLAWMTLALLLFARDLFCVLYVIASVYLVNIRLPTSFALDHSLGHVASRREHGRTSYPEGMYCRLVEVASRRRHNLSQRSHRLAISPYSHSVVTTIRGEGGVFGLSLIHI